MKKTMILAAFAALVSLASCQKEEIIDNGPDNQTSPVFTASIAGSTKTTVDVTDGKVAWEETDEITVTDASIASAVYAIESIDATTGKATFVIKDGETALGDGPYTATYGTEPATAQTYSATAGKLYMTATATSSNSFTFEVQCGLMKLNLTKAGESVKSIAVTSSANVTYTLTCDPAESIATAKDFCIALPTGNYKKIEITNAEDVACTLNSTNGVAVAANHIKPVTFGEGKLSFVPTKGTAKATIGGVETDVNWIQLWKDGPKFAEYNVGTTSENKYGAYFEWTENIASTEWGDNWRMPTADEYQALLDNCTFSSEERNGVKGYVVTGKQGTAYALNSVFFPAGSGAGFGGLNDSGWYWSSSFISSERAWLLSFTISQSYRLVDGDWCTNRYNVRAVLNEAPAVPDGALPGVFSVSATKKVHFSQGNLYADGSNALHFEAYQYTTPSSWDASHVSHFTWSSTVAAAVGKNNDGDYLFCDENHKVAVNGSEAIYYALSMDEWTYLFSYDDHDNDTRRGKYKWATVNGVNGYVIAPDGFDGTLADTYSDDAALAAGNLVFLPAAGERYGSDVYFVGNYSFYWSSSAHDESLAGYVNNAYPGHYGSRYYGYSVRLVTDCE